MAIPSTTLTFAPGQASQPVFVTVNGDVAHEGPETYLVKLATASGATIADNQATGTITDNESAISFSVGDLAVLEGHSGPATGTFTVTASSAPVTGQAVSVKFATADGTANAGTDYVGLPLTTLTFQPGQTSLTVTVTVDGDVRVEGTETFFLNLSAPVGGSVADTQAMATIVDDD